jgi:hypothetical protein
MSKLTSKMKQQKNISILTDRVLEYLRIKDDTKLD